MRPRWSLLTALLPLIPLTFAVPPPDPGAHAETETAADAPEAAEPTADPLVVGTTFNGQHVPPMQIIEGDKLDATTEEGYWQDCA